jgi:hypothetical protein
VNSSGAITADVAAAPAQPSATSTTAAKTACRDALCPHAATRLHFDAGIPPTEALDALAALVDLSLTRSV